VDLVAPRRDDVRAQTLGEHARAPVRVELDVLGRDAGAQHGQVGRVQALLLVVDRREEVGLLIAREPDVELERRAQLDRVAVLAVAAGEDEPMIAVHAADLDAARVEDRVEVEVSSTSLKPSPSVRPCA
jgi:hypothetical protein